MTRAARIIEFIQRYCVTPEGASVGQPMVLAEFQKQFIRDVYDNPAGTRRAILSIARKNGKSGLIAGLLLAHLVGPEAKQNTQIASGALSKEQASLIFSLACKMVQQSPKLAPLVRIIPSGKRLIGLPLNVEYKALAADGKTAHGLSPVLAILDEIDSGLDIDALRVIDDEEINIYLVNPKAPCYIKDDAGTYNYLILPVNFNH